MKALLLFLLLALSGRSPAQQLPDSLRTATVQQLPTDSTLAPALAALPVDTVRVAAPDTALATLSAVSAPERQQRGRDDARRYYHPAKGIFWSSFGVGLLTPPAFIASLGNPATLLPAGGVTVLGAVGPRPGRVRASAPQPTLLRDADYQRGYQQKAGNKKLTRALVGLGTGAALSMTVIIVVLVSLFSNGLGG